MANSIPTFVTDSLGSCPEAGSGVHHWLFSTARLLHHCVPDEDAVCALLHAASSGCGRHVSEQEVLNAVRNSKHCAYVPGQRQIPALAHQVRRTGPDYQKILGILDDGYRQADLEADSPVSLGGDKSHTEEIIDALFPGDPLLCCGLSSFDFRTKPREAWRRKLWDKQFIVPSPMNAVTGLTQDGRESEHTLQNTGPRRFLVVEFDFKAPAEPAPDSPESMLFSFLAGNNLNVADLCAALHRHLAEIAPLALVVHSGGKSLHGWYPAVGVPEEMLRSFMDYATSLGADRATWTRSQFVRMPDGTRDNGKRQHALYFNPEVLPSK